jgi:hypothetical protein
MSINTNNTDEDILDEEIRDDIKEATIIQNTLESFEKPIEIETDPDFKKESITDLYNKIRQIPRKDLTKLLGRLSGTTDLFNKDHSFSGISQSSRDEKTKILKEKLKDKLETIKMKRIAKNNLQKEVVNYETKSIDELVKMIEGTDTKENNSVSKKQNKKIKK